MARYCRLLCPSLNPYCNGCTSMMYSKLFLKYLRRRLNPYCNGCTSMIPNHLHHLSINQNVSILIVMDVLQWCGKRCLMTTQNRVSILIVMDVLQWFSKERASAILAARLNPYCNGCTSMIYWQIYFALSRVFVSILIVMDVLQW